VIVSALVCCGIAYHLLAAVGALRFRRTRANRFYRPPVSILKPVRGRDVGFYEAIRSHAALDYPEFELIFGISDPNDPARGDILRLQKNFPAIPIRIVEAVNDAPNGKVGTLEILAEQANFDFLLVNDADIGVEPDYLNRVMSAFSDPRVGVVTCLYRGHGASLATKAEALGIATEFAPGVLVAHLLSSNGFALGSTMAFRASDLRAINGFGAIRDFLADDYQLGARIAELGKTVALADSVVETNLGRASWSSVWTHQVRWSRTIRVSRPRGYAGYLVTQLTFWCLVALLLGRWRIASTGLAMRMMAAFFSTRALRDYESARLIWFVPVRDLFGTAVWCAGLIGSEIEWRGIRFLLRRDGKLVPL
jgi:ceramide glucosyltransferase